MMSSSCSRTSAKVRLLLCKSKKRVQQRGALFRLHFGVAIFNPLEQAGVCDAGANGSVEVSSSVFPRGRFRTTVGFHSPSVTVQKSDKDHFVRFGDSVGRKFVPYIYELRPV